MQASDEVRRLEADVRMLQAQVGAMEVAVTVFGQEMQRLTELTVRLAEHVNGLAAQLAEVRS